MPIGDQILDLLRQRIEYTVLGPAGTDRVYRDTLFCQRDSEIADKRFECGFGRAHADPGLEAAGATSFGVGDREDFPTVFHQRNGFAHSDQECFCLRIEGSVPLFEGYIHGRLEERGGLRTRIADENIQGAELLGDLFEHRLDLIRLGNVGLDGETGSATLADLGQRILGGCLILDVMDGDSDAALRELECYAATNSARATSNECVLALQ